MAEKCNPETCPLESRIATLEKDSEHNKDAHKEIYEKLEGSKTAVAVVDERILQIKEDTAEIKAAVQEMKAKPGKRWEQLIGAIITLVVGVVAGIVFSKMGLS